MFKSKVFLAEFIGTFALVFIGASSGIVSGGNIVAMALAYGLTLAVFNYAYGYISGMHMNPAVTFAMALQGVVKWGEAAISYWIPQFVGAIAGAFLLKFFLDPLSTQAFAGAASVGALNADYPFYAMVVEVLFTFFLVSTVLHTSVGGKGGQMAGLAIGLTYAIALLSAGPLSGGSLNPARTFGPALFTGDWKDPMMYLIYFLGPLLGALIAVAAYQFFTAEAKVEESDGDDEEDDEEVVETSTEEAK
jgi:MIP family channel proteins